MSQILDSLPNGENDSILCCYVNATSEIQIARITNIPNWYFERVVFPGQRLVFEAVSKAQLEIHTGMMASAILSDTIPCTRLSLNPPPTVTDVKETEVAAKKVAVKVEQREDVAIKNKQKFSMTSQLMQAAVSA
ncbi:protein of unknown function (DUF1830) [Xenococcus sp. PCC 7305]|uniref:DUF1830 domain-containing protein n=1 Tax=Xenococcus sp. PCC 7305 TaxID=102125 RepID=UPI0002ACC622|nr:DUF1830 domain-containing protein [Xenococcus sp. PCC 7305]ELS03754.1 protein of unknown function (DUF1830) [Xenococcus sp. PCC 7305]